MASLLPRRAPRLPLRRALHHPHEEDEAHARGPAIQEGRALLLYLCSKIWGSIPSHILHFSHYKIALQLDVLIFSILSWYFTAGRSSAGRRTPRRRGRSGTWSCHVLAKFRSFSAVSAPIFASKYAFCSIFQNLPGYLAAIFEIWQNFANFATFAKFLLNFHKNC